MLQRFHRAASHGIGLNVECECVCVERALLSASSCRRKQSRQECPLHRISPPHKSQKCTYNSVRKYLIKYTISHRIPRSRKPEPAFRCCAPSTMPIAGPEMPLAASIVLETSECSSSEETSLIRPPNAIDEFFNHFHRSSTTYTKVQPLTNFMSVGGEHAFREPSLKSRSVQSGGHPERSRFSGGGRDLSPRNQRNVDPSAG